MRRVRYSVAMSLDGFIAGPLGGGVPLVQAPGPRVGLRIRHSRVLSATGTVSLDYELTTHP